MLIRVTTGEIDGYRLGDVADYPDATAARLVALGYAECAGGPGAPQDGQGAKAATKAELQARCRDLGVSDRGSKDELQARIDECERAASGEPGGDADDTDGDEAPVLSAEVPR